MNSPSQTEEKLIDPFAGDIFATERSVENLSQNKEQTEPPNWSNSLPKFPPNNVDWDKLLTSLPIEFYVDLPVHLSNTLGRLLNPFPERNIEFSSLVKKELNLAKDFIANSNNSFWLVIHIEGSSEEIVVEFDHYFAVWLVDRALDAETSLQIKPRSLTQTEIAVLEFLSINLAYETNQLLQSPIFKFSSLESEEPNLLKKSRDDGKSLLEIDLQVFYPSSQSLLKIYLSSEALKNLEVEENSLLNSTKRHLEQISRRVNEVRSRIYLGQAELTIADIAALEKDDVILLQNSTFNFVEGDFYGRGEIHLGDDNNFKIQCELVEARIQDVENSLLTIGNEIPIKTFRLMRNWKIMIEDLPEFEKVSTNEFDFTADENNQEATSINETGGIAIENLSVTLNVELEGRRLSLTEVANLRINQVLELGTPNDLVNLLIDKRLIGQGELVAVEDRLGVRIVKLYQ